MLNFLVNNIFDGKVIELVVQFLSEQYILLDFITVIENL